MRLAVRFLGVSVLGVSPVLTEPVRGADLSLLSTASIRFEENRGQMAPSVRFAARGLGYSLLFFDDVTVLRAGSRAVKMRLDGARPSPMKGIGPRPAANHIRGAARVSAPAYARLQRTGPLPGIDVIYYGAESRLEFDFVVRPGADPSSIRMRFEGADHPRIVEDGALALGGGLVQKRPHVYQADGTPVESRYLVHPDGSVGVVLGERDETQTLTIDPVLTYSGYFGASASDTATHVAVDREGFVYIAGTTWSQDFPIAAPYQSTNGAFTDIVVLKLNPRLPPGEIIVYSTYLGGAAFDDVRSMTIDANGNVYLTGQTNSTNFPTSSGAPQTALSGNSDAYVARLDTTLAENGLIFSTLLGGGALEFGMGIAVDEAGMAYVTGATTSTDFPVRGNAVQSGIAGSYDAFITQVDTTKTGQDALVHSTYLGGEFYDVARAIAVRPGGKIAITGITYSESWPLSGIRFQEVYRGLGDVFVAQVDFNIANLDYSTHFGDDEYDEGRKILFDPEGRIIVAGFTLSRNFPRAGDVLQFDFAGGGDIFLAVIDPSKPAAEQLSYSTFFGGNDGDMLLDLSRDSAGRLNLTGYTLSRNFPISSDALQGASANGGIDGFFSVVDIAAKQIRYSSYLTSTGFQTANSVALAPDGTYWLVGATTGNPIEGRFTPLGNTDALVLAFKPDTPASQ